MQSNSCMHMQFGMPRTKVDVVEATRSLPGLQRTKSHRSEISTFSALMPVLSVLSLFSHFLMRYTHDLTFAFFVHSGHICDYVMSQILRNTIVSSHSCLLSLFSLAALRGQAVRGSSPIVDETILPP